MGKFHTAIMKSLSAKKPRAPSAEAPEPARSQRRDDGTVRREIPPRDAECQKQLDRMAQHDA